MFSFYTTLDARARIPTNTKRVGSNDSQELKTIEKTRGANGKQNRGNLEVFACGKERLPASADPFTDPRIRIGLEVGSSTDVPSQSLKLVLLRKRTLENSDAMEYKLATRGGGEEKHAPSVSDSRQTR